MSCSAGAGDGVGVGVVSASSITTVATTGSHMLKINGYSAGKLVMRSGSYAKSCEFEAAGHTWCILYYPNGYSKEVADHISLYLRLARNVDDVVVNARFRFTLVPHHCSSDGGAAARGKNKAKPKPNRPQAVVPYHRQSLTAEFRRTYAPGFPWFVRREVLEKSEYLVDDSFAVRCDIDVVETLAVSDLTVEAHDLFRLSLLPACTLKD